MKYSCRSSSCGDANWPLTLCVVLVISAIPGFGQTNVLTFRNDNARTGQNLTETALTPANVTPSTFGKLFTVSLDGKVDAQPLFLSGVQVPVVGRRSVVYAATEHDSVYAFDANTGRVYWHVTLLKSGETPSDSRNCEQVLPEIGITGTPVIDPAAGPHGTIYVVAMSKDASGNYYQRFHGLDVTTGAEEFGGPVLVAASYPGSGDNSVNGRVVFDAKQYKSRPGLTLLNGVVYTAWGSHCDIRPYTGWLIGYDRLTLRQTAVFNFAPNGSEAGLWGSGGGVAADSAGNIFTNLGNGTFDTTLNAFGFPSHADFGNAFVRVQLSNGQLAATDYWTMDNTVNESGGDQDLGSGGVLLLPNLTDSTGKVRHLGTGAGKDGNVYVFDRDSMGKFSPSNNNTLYEEIAGGLGGSEFGSPAWFNNTVYYGAAGDFIRAFKSTAARLVNPPSSRTAGTFSYPGSSPVISSNGSSHAVLWAYENTSPAVLHAFDPNNLGTEFYNSNQAANGRDRLGDGNKFMVPTVAGGEVFVGGTNGVSAFGLLNHGPIPDGIYVVKNGVSGQVLDDPGSSTAPGKQMVQYPNNGGANQHWRFTLQASGAYLIQNVYSGQFLTDPNGSKSTGTPLVQDPSAGGVSQLWTLVASGTTFAIVNKAGNLYVDDPGSSKQQLQGMTLEASNGGSDQHWTLQ